MAAISLGKKTISRIKDEIYFIAEIGQNHQGNLNFAKEMIVTAKKIGCDCVKFQKSCLTRKFTKSALNRLYDNVNSWGKTYGEHKNHLEFSLEQYKELQRFCKEIDIEFTASAMDEVSLKDLDELNVPFIKIGSGDNNNFPMLKKAALLQRPLVISTGMQSLDTIDKIVEIMKTANKTNYALLHCVSSYPTKPIDCHLRMITLLKDKYPNIVIGYSGHELGIDITKAAALLGARIIERHFTMDKNLKGSDHCCSLIPTEMALLIDSLQFMKNQLYLKHSNYDNKAIQRILNTDNNLILLALQPVIEKTILPCELNCKQKLGKSIVANRSVKCGKILEIEDIAIKVSEPLGIPAEQYDTILGSTLKNSIEEDFPVSYKDIV